MLNLLVIYLPLYFLSGLRPISLINGVFAVLENAAYNIL